LSEEQRHRIRSDVARLLQQGRSERQAAEHLTAAYRHERLIGPEEHISRRQVNYYAAAVRQAWRECYHAEVAAHQAQMLAAARQAMAEAWEAWFASQVGPTTTERVRDTAGAAQIRVVTRQSAGDPRYLRQVLAALDYTIRLLGLDAAARTEVSRPYQNPVEVRAFDEPSH
jgi:hypothetical protein